MGWPMGVTATVRRRVQDGVDSFQCPVWREATQEVANVLPMPSSTADMGERRPEGTVATMRVCMPRSWSGGLYGATIDLPDPWGAGWRVIGDPTPFSDGLLHDCPWNVVAEVTRADG